jgi:chaperone required for assembly of F1-ATPase
MAPPSPVERSVLTQTIESLKPIKRFYSGVSVAPGEGGFAVLLDGRAPRSPGRRPLVLPTEALAEVVAAEWASQAETIDLVSMPATRLTHTVLDAIPAAHASVAAKVAEQAAADVVCYFADYPAGLVARQEAVWAPLITWAGEALGLRFERAAGIVHTAQPPETLVAVETIAAGLDDFALAGLALAASTLGSAILALALWRGRLTGGQAFAASHLDEISQAETWGLDAEASQRADAILADSEMLKAWFSALEPGMPT